MMNFRGFDRGSKRLSDCAFAISFFDSLDGCLTVAVLISHDLDAADVSTDDALHALLLRDDTHWRKGDRGIAVA